MVKKGVVKKHSSFESGKTIKVISYPAVADSVDLPDISFSKLKDKDAFLLLTTSEKDSFYKTNETSFDRQKALAVQTRLGKLFSLLRCECGDSDATINIIGRRAALLRVRQEDGRINIEAHWNLFVPYFARITKSPVVHPEILDVFSVAVFHYAVVAMKCRRVTTRTLINLIIDTYKVQPALLLASLDIFNKPNIYHIRPTIAWLKDIVAANDRYRLQIDVSAVAEISDIAPEFLAEVTCFIHKVVKNYAFRYVDYLWTQSYRITFGPRSAIRMVTFDGRNIVVNIRPLIRQPEWKPALYLSLGYAIMLAILHASGRKDGKENVYLAMTKTWNRYLSFGGSAEQQNVSELYGFPIQTAKQQCCDLLKGMIGKRGIEFADDFIMHLNYSAKETFIEKLKLLNEKQPGKSAGVYYEQLWNTVRNINATLMRNNINYSKLIEVLRNDNIDHLQLAEFLRTGRLDNRDVVDVSDWLLLRTLLYDLINTPKVFKNDYKMLLKVLTKVNKTLIVYAWTLGLANDARHEMVSAYIAKLINAIFVFDRVKIYEIVADPVECLEAEAVTGYLLNWAGLTQEKRLSLIEGSLSKLPRNLLTHLRVESANDVDAMIRVIGVRTGGLIGFCLHQVYLWGSTGDAITERIRFYFPRLLQHAQEVILPEKIIMGGAMLLLLLAQIISDERDGMADNIVISEEERQIVLHLIKQCIDWEQKHFVVMVAGIAAGYTGNIDGWILQQFDALLGRYRGGDRVVLRSVVQLDVENLIERTLMTAKIGDEATLLRKIQLLRIGVDPVVSDQTNHFLKAIAFRCGISSPEVTLKKRDISKFLRKLSEHIQEKNRSGLLRRRNRPA
jgi:hypothetical protein